jgi:hypothetical protein
MALHRRLLTEREARYVDMLPDEALSNTSPIFEVAKAASLSFKDAALHAQVTSLCCIRLDAAYIPLIVVPGWRTIDALISTPRIVINSSFLCHAHVFALDFSAFTPPSPSSCSPSSSCVSLPCAHNL